MKREEVLSFVNEVKQFDNVNASVSNIFVNEPEHQYLDGQKSIAYIDGNVFDCLPDEVQKTLIIYAILLLSGDGLPRIKNGMIVKEQWGNYICKSLGISCYTQKELDFQMVIARRKCYRDEKSSYFKVGDVLIDPPSMKKYTIINIGKVTLDNKRPISIKSDNDELILDEEILIRKFAILA